MHLIIHPNGGLGNLLFQFFNAYSLYKKYNCKIDFVINQRYWRGDITTFKLFKHLNYINIDHNNIHYIQHNETDSLYKEIILDTNKNYKIFGYYQSYKYSQKYINEIKNVLFSTIQTTYIQIEQQYHTLKNNKQTCLIHVRRGDYVNNPYHPLCSDEYYHTAIKHIPNCKYFIFSDDIPFVSSWSVLKNIDHVIIDIQDPEEILVMMSLCDNFIIANSSLSLCAYLLRKNQTAKLVAPRKWFNHLPYKIEDFIPLEGIII